MRHGRFISLSLAAAAVMAISPAMAAAAPASLTDDLASGGATDANTWLVEPGQVRLKPAVSTNFDGASTTDGWPSATWPGGTPASDGGGFTNLNGARVESMPVSGGAVEFSATFGTAAFQHAGFGDFATGPWAMFSTGSGSSGDLFARTWTGTGEESESTPITGVTPGTRHTYRIEWTATQASFFVDGEFKVTRQVVIPSSMRPGASDADADAASLKVDWIGVAPYPAAGTYVSRVHEASDARAVWGTLTPAAGAGIAFQTRTGKSLTPDDGTWSEYQPLGAGNTIQSPPRRNIQYRATLTSAGTSTPVLDDVVMTYEIDSTPPAIAAIDSVAVSGASASVKFRASDADFASFECRLDGGAFAACTSPDQFAGLSLGAHSVSVRVLDAVGNAGPVASRDFTITSTAGGVLGGNTPDTLAPKAKIITGSVRASRKGIVKIGVKCPAGEVSCRVDLKLKRGGKTVARKAALIQGGKTLKIKLTLKRAARLRLAARGRLNVTAVAQVKDAAGNGKRVQRSIVLLSHSS